MSEIDCAASELAVFSGVPRVQLEAQMKTPAPAVTGRGHGRTSKEFDSMSVPTRSLTPALRFSILKRDNFTCIYCGRSAPDVALHVDHIIPWSKRQRHERTNLAAACTECNHGKRDHSVQEAIVRMVYAREAALAGSGRVTCNACGIPFLAIDDPAGRPIEDIDMCETCDAQEQRSWTRGFHAGLARAEDCGVGR